MHSHMQTLLLVAGYETDPHKDDAIQVMVSESGVYHGDLGQRNLETMPFRSFLQAAQQAADGRPAQHLYLAQASSLASW